MSIALLCLRAYGTACSRLDRSSTDQCCGIVQSGIDAHLPHESTQLLPVSVQIGFIVYALGKPLDPFLHKSQH